MQFHLFIPPPVSPAQGYTRKKMLQVSEISLPMRSSKIFMVSSLTLKSSIHFELFPAFSVRKWTSSVYLQVCVQFCQHHELKRLFIPQFMLFLPPLSNIN